MTLNEARKILGVVDQTPLTVVKVQYRRLAMAHHPDRPTGNREKFDLITKAYELICAAPVRCAECRGTGKIVIVRGFHAVQMQCPSCATRGDI